MNLCLSIPNLDTIFFYIIFVITIPGFLFSSGDYETLKYYLPALVMAAVTLTEAGKPNLFINLYPTDCSENVSFSGFVSSNLINGLAIVGILLQSLSLSAATSSITLGLGSGLIIFAITFPMAQQVLPHLIREGDFTFKHLSNGSINFPGNWHMYMLGIIFSLLLLFIQYIFLYVLINYILSSNIKLI